MIPGNANPLLLKSSGTTSSQYQISRSLRFNSADSAYLSRTPASAGNRKTWTWSGWVKAPEANSRLFRAGNYLLRFTDGALEFKGLSTIRLTTRLYRDPSAWYHIILAVDTTQANGSNRVVIYTNGIQEVSYSSSADPTQNLDLDINDAIIHYLGTNNTNYFDGYFADIHFIDGQALTPASFGETDATTGEWIPKAYTGTYGTNGFHLDFADNSAATATTLGKDSSGNNNNWTPNNLSVTAGAGNDSFVDTPTSYGADTGVGGEVRGNYCTFNPVDVANAGAAPWVIANGGLEARDASSSIYGTVPGTMAVSNGKWYWEVLINTGLTAPGDGYDAVGIESVTETLTSRSFWGQLNSCWYASDGRKWVNGSASGYGNTFADGVVIGVALNLDASTITFYRNNVSQGAIAFTTGSNIFYRPAVSNYNNSGGVIYTANFGQRPFAYTAPSGFKALCDTNLPAPTIVKPSTVMDVVTYTGTGASLTPTSSLGFSPDLVWIKGRSGATDHALYDTVRGAQARLESNNTDAEVTADGGLTAFNSNGFTLGTLAQVNTNTATYAGCCWDAGSSTVTNTSGTIQSSVRANASAGFSIVTYTGTGANATVGHGLGVAPGLVIVKSRGANLVNWGVWHSSFAGTEYVLLSTTGAKTTDTTMWNSTAPSSSVFSLGTNATVNQSTYNYVAYCFAPVAGYSAFGSYTGNGNADGPFVYTGFRPRWIMFKQTSSTSSWAIFDAARNPYNLSNLKLQANSASSENTDTSTNSPVDILSNGFKLRGSGADGNTSTNTYIYAAFAEFPFQFARAR